MKSVLALALLSLVFYTTSAQYYVAFGDSLSDTGNLQSISGGAVKLPYGMTYFKKATGRFSNGRLWLDFFMDEMGSKYLNPIQPYVSGNKKLDYSSGVNFAIAGATANEDFASGQLPPGISFSHQVDSFKTFVDDCSNGGANLPSSDTVKSGIGIVLVGGNDINYMIMQGTSNDDIVNSMPDIINSIKDGINEIAKQGIQKFVVLNLPPQGCLPLYLQQQSDSNPDYDDTNCLKDINKLSVRFNKMLLDMLKSVKAGKDIIYGDVFASAMQIYSSPEAFSFDPEIALQACCGSGGGSYNCDPTSGQFCGCSSKSDVCDSLDKSINWDGVHFTENFYKQVADLVFNQENLIVKGSNFLNY